MSMMLRLGWLVALTTLCLRAGTPPDSTASTIPHLYHNPPASIQQNVITNLTCVIEPGNRQVLAVKVFLRNNTEKNFKELRMQYKNGTFVLPVIPEMLNGRYLYYFLVAEFRDFAALAFPADNPETNPLKVPIIPAKKK